MIDVRRTKRVKNGTKKNVIFGRKVVVTASFNSCRQQRKQK